MITRLYASHKKTSDKCTYSEVNIGSKQQEAVNIYIQTANMNCQINTW